MKHFLDLIRSLTIKQRRELFILGKMMQHGTSYTKIANNHGLSVWFVSACARGKYRMSKACRRALESDLDMSLAEFYDKEEKFPRR